MDKALISDLLLKLVQAVAGNDRKKAACTVHRLHDLILMKPGVSQLPSTSESDVTSFY